jgi:hypothetical protein
MCMQQLRPTNSVIHCLECVAFGCLRRDEPVDGVVEQAHQSGTTTPNGIIWQYEASVA